MGAAAAIFNQPGSVASTTNTTTIGVQPAIAPNTGRLTGTCYGQAIPVLMGRTCSQGIPLWSGIQAGAAASAGGANSVAALGTTLASLPATVGTVAPATGSGNVTGSFAAGSAAGGVGGISFAMAFGRPSADSLGAILKRIWVNSVLVYDATVNPIVKQSGLTFRFYSGNETQTADPAIANDPNITAALAPAFRGMIYIVFENFPMTWTGMTFPQVTCDISQISAAANVVTQFNPLSNFKNFQARYFDFAAGLLYLTGYGGNTSAGADDPTIDVYDVQKGQYLTTYHVSFRSDFSFGAPYNNGKYFYLPYASADNTGLLSMFDRTTGQVVSQAACVFIDLLCAGKGIAPAGIDEYIIAGSLVFGGWGMFKRQGTSLTICDDENVGDAVNKITGACYAAEPGINISDKPLLGYTGVATDADVNPTPVDTTQFAVYYVGALDNTVKIQIMAVGKSSETPFVYAPSIYPPSGYTPILNRLEAVFISTPAVAAGIAMRNFGLWGNAGTGITAKGQYARVQYTLFARQVMQTVITYATGFKVLNMFGGTPSNPYLSVFVEDTVNSIVYLKVYSTPWNVVLPSPQTLAFDNIPARNPVGGEYAVPTADDFFNGAYVEVNSVVLPAFVTTISQYSATNCRDPDNYDLVTVRSIATGNLVHINLATGAISITDQGASTWALADGTPITGFDFDSGDIYWPSQNVCIFAASINPGSGDTIDYPGTYSLGASSDDTYNLQKCITECCLAAGLQSGQLAFDNVSGITIYGCMFNQQIRLIDALGQICGLFRVDVIESNNQIKFVGRLDNPITLNATIAQTQLAFNDQTSTNDGTLLLNQRAALSDLPYLLTLNYLDINNFCLVGTQAVRRTKYPIVTTPTIASLTLSVPIVLDTTSAGLWLIRCLYDMWGGQTQNQFRIGQAFLALEAGDYMTVSDGTRQYTVKIAEIIKNADWSLSITAATVREVILFADGSTQPLPPTTVQTLQKQQTFSGYYITNMLLYPTDKVDANGNFPHYWTAPGACTLYQQADDLSLSPLSTLLQAPSIGTTTTAPYAPGSAVYQYDTTSAIGVSFTNPNPIIPFTDSDEAWLSGQNFFLLGSNTLGWEVIYFRHYFLADNGQYVFYQLLRGQRGTDYLADLHSSGETIIFPTLQTISRLPLSVSTFGAPVLLRAVPTGVDSFSSNIATTLIFSSGGPLVPLAPTNLNAENTLLVDPDIILTWTRRDRVSGGMVDGTGAQVMSESVLMFTVQILSNDGLSVIRIYEDVTAETVTYAHADQVSDGFDATTASTINFRVQQISTDVGYGYPAQAVCAIIQG